MKETLKESFNLRNKKSVTVLGLIYSLLLIFGTSYMQVGNASLVFENKLISVFALIILLVIFRTLIIVLFNFLDNYKVKDNKKNSKFRNYFEKYPFIVSMIVIIILWLPYIISFYPAILSPDPSFQIKQFFGIPNKYSEYSILLDENVIITNHHPVVHTLLLGSCLKLGVNIGNDNLGLFLYSIIQILILSSVLSCTIKYMTKIKTPYKYRLLALLIYGLVPMFPLYAMSAVKDVIFTSLTILYIILVYHLVKNKKEKLKLDDLILIFILLVLMMLFRNNGFHVILLSFPFVIFANKENFKKLLLVFIVFLGFNYSYNNLILPSFKITPSSPREKFSIPFQQTARYVKYHDNLTEEEYNIYDKVLDMSDLASRYKPEISDPVKNKFNRYTTDKELKEYFKTWFNDLLKDPVLYIDSTINNTYGYFYPPKTNWYVYYKYDTRIVKDGFDYHYNGLKTSRKILSNFAIAYPYIPIIGWISNIGFNTWILFFLVTYLIYKKKYRGIIYLIPSYIALLICVASPVNAYFRYAMPIVFALPLTLALFYDYIRERSEIYEKK